MVYELLNRSDKDRFISPLCFFQQKCKELALYHMENLIILYQEHKHIIKEDVINNIEFIHNKKLSP